MRYRKLDSNGDYVWGHGAADFLVNSPDAVAQAILTRLKLFRGEWFLDLTAGMPWNTEVLGAGTQGTRDQAVKAVVLGTEGVVEMVAYSSVVTGRSWEVSGTVNTLYGETPFSAPLGQ